MALDEQRGIVYAPTGSASSDFYGANRIGDNLYANSLLALDAATGKRIWHFQFVRHDILDRDLPSPPNLVTVRHGGRTIQAVAQSTKQGYVFLFDRANGKPLFPIEYRKFPRAMCPARSQRTRSPYPPARAVLAAAADEGHVDDPHSGSARVGARGVCKMRSEGPFIPLRVGQPTIVFPATTAARSGADRRSIPRPGCIT